MGWGKTGAKMAEMVRTTPEATGAFDQLY